MGLAELKLAKQALDEAKKLIADKQTANDLGIVVKIASKELDAARTNPAATPSIRDAFNMAATLVPIANGFLNNGKLPLLQLLKDKSKHEKMGETLKVAFEANDPVVVGFVQNLIDNNELQDAVIRLAARNPKLCQIERSQDEQTYTVKLSMVGMSVSLPIEKEYNDKAKEIYDTLNQKKPPQPPKGPSI